MNMNEYILILLRKICLPTNSQARDLLGDGLSELGM